MAIPVYCYICRDHFCVHAIAESKQRSLKQDLWRREMMMAQNAALAFEADATQKFINDKAQLPPNKKLLLLRRK